MIWTINITLISGMYFKNKWQATLELDPTLNLEDLHHLIQKVVGFDNDHLYEFSTAKEAYSRQATRFNDENEKIYSSTLESLYPLEKGHKLFYIFDFGDDWTFTISPSRKKPQPAQDCVIYPRVIQETGDKPVQYPNFE